MMCASIINQMRLGGSRHFSSCNIQKITDAFQFIKTDIQFSAMGFFKINYRTVCGVNNLRPFYIPSVYFPKIWEKLWKNTLEIIFEYFQSKIVEKFQMINSITTYLIIYIQFYPLYANDSGSVFHHKVDKNWTSIAHLLRIR